MNVDDLNQMTEKVKTVIRLLNELTEEEKKELFDARLKEALEKLQLEKEPLYGTGGLYNYGIDSLKGVFSRQKLNDSGDLPQLDR